MDSIYIFFSYHPLRLVCDVTCCIIFLMRLWLLEPKFRAKIPMKLNVPDDLFSK